jgi:hypothetical protein
MDDNNYVSPEDISLDRNELMMIILATAIKSLGENNVLVVPDCAMHFPIEIKVDPGANEVRLVLLEGADTIELWDQISEAHNKREVTVDEVVKSEVSNGA